MNRNEFFANFKKEDLKYYETYMDVIQRFRQHFGLAQYSIKQLDQYLWQLGKWYFNQYGLTYKYYNREEASPFPYEDIRGKFWWGEMMFVTNHLSVGYWKEQIIFSQRNFFLFLQAVSEKPNQTEKAHSIISL